MVKKKVRSTILKERMIQKGDHVILGLSGGPDSVCLFHVLKELREELGFFLSAVHVNHKLRPGAAEEDQAYVENLCQREEIRCRVFVKDCEAIMRERKMTGEEAGRAARYEAFRQSAEDLERQGIPSARIKIAVAQNSDDQAETVLLRLLRGSGPDGLAGIAYTRMEDGIAVIRPLLDVPRKEIQQYCEEHQLRPRIDHTNLQPVYTRNKVRLQLIPYLREHFNPAVCDALVRLSRIAGEDKEFLWACADRASRQCQEEPGVLNLEKLREQSPAIRRRIILKAFEQAGLTQDITAAHLEAAERLLRTTEPEKGAGGGKKLDFPKGYRMEVRGGTVRVFHRETETANADRADFLSCARLEQRITEEIPKEYPPGAAIFDWDKIRQAHGDDPRICLRGRRAGDYIRLRAGRKKIQDFFVDQKIPRELRDQIPLAAAGSEILCVFSGNGTFLKKNRRTEKYKLDETTKKALILEIICDM